MKPFTAGVAAIPFPVAWVLGSLALTAVLAGRRSRRWWLTLGCLVYAVAVSAAWFHGERHFILPLAGWIGCIIGSSIAVPLLFGRRETQTRAFLAIEMLVGGIAGATVIPLSVYLVVGLSCTLIPQLCGVDEVSQVLTPSQGIVLDTVPVVFNLNPNQPDGGGTPAKRQAMRSDLMITLLPQFHESLTPSGPFEIGPTGERLELRTVFVASDSTRRVLQGYGFLGSGSDLQLLMTSGGAPAFGARFVRVELTANMRVPVTKVRWRSGHPVALGP